jgi:Lar family restriction alleviation protein
MTEELLPCPFCGGKPYLANVVMAGCYYVLCTDCRMQSDDGRRDRVIAAWNTRALTPPAAIEWNTGAPPVHVSDRPTGKEVMPVDDDSTDTRPDVAPGGNTLSGGVTPPDATPPSMPPLAEVIEHYGIDALCRALAPEIVREAGETTATAWTPPEDRRGNFECLGKVRGFWSQVGWKQAMDDTWNWYVLLDKNPLPVAPTAFAPLPEGKP